MFLSAGRISGKAGWCRMSSGSTLCIFLRKEPGQSNLPPGWDIRHFSASFGCKQCTKFMCSPGSHSRFWERCLHCYNFPVLSFRQEIRKVSLAQCNDSSNPALSPLQWLQEMVFWVDSWTGITTCCPFSWHSLSTYSCHLGPLEGTSIGNQSLLEAARTFATGARVAAL